MKLKQLEQEGIGRDELMAYLKDKDEFKDLYDALDEEKMHKILFK